MNVHFTRMEGTGQRKSYILGVWDDGGGIVGQQTQKIIANKVPDILLHSKKLKC